jgi:hypothetical protein
VDAEPRSVHTPALPEFLRPARIRLAQCRTAPTKTRTIPAYRAAWQLTCTMGSCGPRMQNPSPPKIRRTPTPTSRSSAVERRFRSRVPIAVVASGIFGFRVFPCLPYQRAR